MYLVCPHLLALDPRHGVHMTYAKGPRCRHDGPEACLAAERKLAARGIKHPNPHQHEPRLEDPEGHTTAHVVIPPGGELELDHPDLFCELDGAALVWGDLDRAEPIDLDAP